MRAALRAALLGAALLACGPAHGQGGPPELDTPFVTTPDNVVRAMLDLARLRPGERLVDLGSGDGRIVIEAARLGAVAHGVEIDPRLVAVSREAAQRAGVAARATFAAEDLFDTDFAHAAVVTMYLLPDVNARLAPRLYATLAPGARIVSHDYGLGDWPPDATVEVDAPGKSVGMSRRSTLYRWTVPAKLAGRWQGGAAGASTALDLAQTWQRAAGTLLWRGNAYRVDDARIDGRTLAVDLSAGRPTLVLRLTLADDGTLAGTLREGAQAATEIRLTRMQ